MRCLIQMNYPAACASAWISPRPANNPDILLMDEAFSALDPLIRTEMQDELVKLQAQHQRTIVFISTIWMKRCASAIASPSCRAVR